MHFFSQNFCTGICENVKPCGDRVLSPRAYAQDNKVKIMHKFVKISEVFSRKSIYYINRM